LIETVAEGALRGWISSSPTISTAPTGQHVIASDG